MERPRRSAATTQLQPATPPATPPKAQPKVLTKGKSKEEKAEAKKGTGLVDLGDAVKAMQKECDRPLFEAPQRRYIPTRHAQLGTLLGGEEHPGVPSSIYIEIKGNEHSGKTSVCFAMADAVINQPAGVCEMQVPGGVQEVPVPRKVLYLDFEQALDATYMKRCIRNSVFAETDEETGRVTNAKDANIYIHQPDTLEAGVDVAINLIPTGQFGLVVMDSVAAMLAEAEQDKAMGENTMGEQARAMGKMFRKTLHMLRRYGVTIVLVNQWRNKIGVSYGDPRVSPGGVASAYYDSIVLDVSGPKVSAWFPGAGKEVNVKSTKNKITGTKATAHYHLSNANGGISAEVELIETLLGCGFLDNAQQGRKATLTFPGDRPREWPNRYALYCDLLKPEVFAVFAAAARKHAPKMYGAIDVTTNSEKVAMQGNGGVALPTV